MILLVIKDTERPEQNYRLLIEEQIVDNKNFRISYARAPIMESSIRISISTINENGIPCYKEIHGLELSEEKLRSYYLYMNEKESSLGGDYLDDDFGYYDEVMNAFDNLINSGLSEFTSKALNIFNEVKAYSNKIGSGKNAI